MSGPPVVPECIRTAAEGYRWTRITFGESGADVYRLESGDTGDQFYLKHGTGRVAEEITAEADRLQWLAKFLAVPQIRIFFQAGDEAWLLTTAIRGLNADDALKTDPDGRVEIVRALAEFLRGLHTLPVAECPFNSDHELRLIDARRNLVAEKVDEEDFDDIHEGWSAGQVWEEIQALLPIAAERVVAHGDFSTGNIILQDRKVIGCIDVGRLGAADRYQDLAILWNNLEEFGDDLQSTLFEAYGIEEIDQRRLKFHLCLDEFF